MSRIIGTRFPWTAIMLALASMQVWGAQAPKAAATGPVPAQIINAKKVFISNLGGGCSRFGQSEFNGGPDRPYNEFYSAMKSWGRFELEAAPADAELDLEVSLPCPAARANSPFGGSYGTDNDPQLSLVIRDVKTGIALWGLTEHIETAALQSNRDKNFESAMRALVDRLEGLVAGH
ncbi:MAG TPA: hypothetical protein VEO19_14785 [Terriglobia bacterium]|nr:hypothetical protein [Terriglobia bacterium]